MPTSPAQLRERPKEAGRAVSLTALHKHFGSVHAVRGLDLDINPGEVVAFLGPNRAGKTSTIDLVLGLSTPSSGDVSVFGRPPREAIQGGLVSAVMQSGGLLKDLTVGETVRYVGALFADRRPAPEVLERAGIAALKDRLVGKCSGGEQQRLRFALALLSDPDLIVLDEPTSGMDVEGRRSFWRAIRADVDRGRTVLFATHYLEEADLYADRIVVIRHGEIVADGSAAEVKAMVFGRTVRVTWPDATEDDLAGIPQAEQVERRGDTVLVRSRDSDAVARYLLTQTPSHDLEIAARGLEDAFVALTGDADTSDVPR